MTREGALDPARRAQVAATAAAAREVDGVEALDEQVHLDLHSSAVEGAEHLVEIAPGTPDVVGYAHVDLRTPGLATAHLVVHPDHRRRGVGSSLVARVAELAVPRQLGLWAHGALPAAAALAARTGLRRTRELRQLRRELREPLGWPAYPDDVIVRTFEPGRDDEAWIDLNAAAFHDHPSQGRLELDDLHERMDQPWFDPLGFFVVEREGELVGFHWTKVHRDSSSGATAVGEVYVLGVSPAAQGLGLGTALTLTGLHHLRELGLDTVLLYVEADNVAALAVYERLGFSVVAIDVMYGEPPGRS